MRNGLFCGQECKKTAPKRRRFDIQVLSFAFPSLPSRAKENALGPPDPPTGKSLPFPWWGEGLGKKKEEDFYRGIMPTMTAKIMHRMENTQT